MTSRDRARAPFRMTPVVFHVLLSVADGDAHAYGIMKEVEVRTGGSVSVGPGSMHFTLNKLLDADMIADAPRRSGADHDSRRKYYRITPYGRDVLAAELRSLAQIVEVAREKKLIPGGS